MSKKHRIPAVLSVTALACLAFTNALAQQATASPDSTPEPKVAGLGLVVITAQKRKEDVRKVPLSVSVVSGDSIQENHVNNVDDLTRNVPNLSFTSQAGAGLSNLEIRGVSSQAGSSTVSVYLDDVSLTTLNLPSEGGAEPRFFDVDRVEVLRGPQGTLYGASSLGGTIKFISRQPDAKSFSGNVYTELSNTSHGGSNYVAQAVLNVPLIKDNTALRIGVQSGHDSGYIDQVSPTTLAVVNKGINSSNWDVLKLALKTEFAPGWSATPALIYQRTKSDDIDAAFFTVGSFQLPYGSTATPATLGLFQTSKTVREPGTDTLFVPSLTVNGDVGFGDLTGVLSGFRRRFDRIQDGTLVNVGYIASQITDPALQATVNGLPSVITLNNKIDQTSLELRVASKNYDPSRGPLTWIGGVYLAQTKTQAFDNEPIVGINAAFTAAGININDPAQLGGTFPGAFIGDSSYYSARHYDDKQSAVFGELTYNASSALRATVGLRALKASEHFTREGNYYYAGGPVTAAVDTSATKVTPRVTVSWDMSPTTTLYSNISNGFRLGGANRPIPPSALVSQDMANLHLTGSPPATFNSDSLWNYEIGTKSRFLDNRVSVNASAYHIDWKNIQQDVYLPLSAFDFQTNAGDAKIDGLELEGRMLVTDAFTLSAAGSYTRAVFAQDVTALGLRADGTANARAGDPIQGVPNYSARLGAEYRFAATDFGSAYLRASGQWTGSSHGSVDPTSSDYLRPAYVTADASGGLTVNHWEFSLFIKNLTNNHTTIQRPSIQSLTEAYYIRPRTIGVTGTYDF